MKYKKSMLSVTSRCETRMRSEYSGTMTGVYNRARSWLSAFFALQEAILSDEFLSGKHSFPFWFSKLTPISSKLLTKYFSSFSPPGCLQKGHLLYLLYVDCQCHPHITSVPKWLCIARNGSELTSQVKD